MKNIPPELLTLSPKGTVPVLVLEAPVEIINPGAVDGLSKIKGAQQVVDESLDIMLWALKRNDPQNLLYAQQTDALPEMLRIISVNDSQFKPSLENYKHAKRFHENSEEYYRLQCEPFIQQLEQRLARHDFLMGPTPSLLDYALLPFIRQFSRVNRQRYLQGPYSYLQRWLTQHLQSQLFSKAMVKYPFWLDNHQEFLLGP